jgi:hypothetical protein
MKLKTKLNKSYLITEIGIVHTFVNLKNANSLTLKQCVFRAVYFKLNFLQFLP